MSYRVCVITVSDTASKDASTDKSGPILAQIIQAHAQYEVVKTAIVPDELPDIQAAVKAAIDEIDVDAVITTGGTGFGARDCTPEALAPLIHKHATGLTQALIAHSLTKTPMAALSRLISGVHVKANSATKAGALIVALPGSTKAVRECAELLLGSEAKKGVMSHALSLCSDRVEAADQLHLQMNGPRTGRSPHHCSACAAEALEASQTDTSKALRPRTSPFTLVPLKEALGLVEQHTPSTSRVGAEFLPVDEELIGKVLAEDVCAPFDIPQATTTNVDGYAVLNQEYLAGSEWTVVPRSATLSDGSVVRVNTGQPVPENTDTVVMVEDTELISHSEGEETRIRLLADVVTGDNLRLAGSDVRQGQVVLPAGTLVSQLGGEIGTLIFLGVKNVKVVKPPVIALLSTGDELEDLVPKEPSSAPKTDGWGLKIYDTNRPALRTLLNAMGLRVLDLGIQRDHREELAAKLKLAVEQADVILTTGGTSMGESDYLKPLLKQLGAHIHFGRVAVKPGKPTTFATVADKQFFALPGNPASALVCFYVFVLPCLKKRLGYAPTDHGRTQSGNRWSISHTRVLTASELSRDTRTEFHRVRVVPREDGTLVAYSTGSQRSSGMHSMAAANALIQVDPLDPQRPEDRDIAAGTYVSAMLIGL